MGTTDSLKNNKAATASIIAAGGSRPSWLRYGAFAASLAIATFVNLLVDDIFPGHTKYLWLLLSFVFTAWFGGLGPTTLNLLLGPVALVFFIMPPRFCMQIESTADQFGVALYFMTTLALFVFFWQRRKQCMVLAHADRCKDQHLAVLSHELRNPLAAIRNAVYLLGEQKQSAHLHQMARMLIERQVDQMTRLIDDLLEVSRINTGKFRLQPEQIDLNCAVKHAVETVRPLISQHRHELTVSLPSQPIWVHADAARMEQVFGNLLTNAVKYTADGGQISIDVRQEKERVRLCVRDTGVGIAPQLLPHIFNLFTQAEGSLSRSQGGLGIGLALVKQIVELHGGQVDVLSTLGKGSEFIVSLPVILLPTPPAIVASRSTEQPTPVSLRVLIVEDNKDSAQTMESLLMITGYASLTVYDGASALVAVAEFQPNVILMDIGLPDMDGYEVAKSIRQQVLHKDIVLLALTGHGSDSDRQRSEEAGFEHHLVKPVNFRELQQILTEIAKTALLDVEPESAVGI